MYRLPDRDLSDNLGAEKPCMCPVPSPNDIIGVVVVVGHMLAGYTTYPQAWPLHVCTTSFGGQCWC